MTPPKTIAPPKGFRGAFAENIRVVSSILPPPTTKNLTNCVFLLNRRFMAMSILWISYHTGTVYDFSGGLIIGLPISSTASSNRPSPPTPAPAARGCRVRELKLLPESKRPQMWRRRREYKHTARPGDRGIIASSLTSRVQGGNDLSPVRAFSDPPCHPPTLTNGFSLTARTFLPPLVVATKLYRQR
jgi:hypothetical protein